jgi:MFS family permease
MGDLSSILRGLSVGLFVAGATMSDNVWLLLGAWLSFMIALAMVGLVRVHLRLTLAFVIPLAVSSLVINTLITAVPGELLSDRFGRAVPLALALAFRVSAIAAAIQLCFLPLIANGNLVNFLRAWRLPDSAVLVVIGGITILAEVRARGRQIFEARLAQGLGTANRWGALRQLPFMLMPLFASMLESSAARALLWQERRLVNQLANYRVTDQKTDSAYLWSARLFVSGAWCVAAVLWRSK